MLLFLVAVGLAFGIRKLCPSSVRVRPTFHWVALPVVAVAMQAALGLSPLRHLGGNAHFSVVLVSYGLVGIWLVANAATQMRPLRGPALVICIGWLANTVAIAANRGMPVSRWAMSQIGVRHPTVSQGNLFKHVLSGSHTLLPWLGDAIPVAFPVVRNVISLGDIVMFVGVILGTRYVEFSAAKSERRSTPFSHRDDLYPAPNPP